MKKLLAILFALSILVGCGAKVEASFKAADADLTVSGKTLTPGMKYSDPVITGWLEFTELTSCAYVGNDKVYDYTDFSVYTYNDGVDDFILSVEFKNETETSKGIHIGSTKAEVIKAYGEDYTTKILNMVYTDGQVNATFLIVEDKVAGISLNYRPQ